MSQKVQGSLWQQLFLPRNPVPTNTDFIRLLMNELLRSFLLPWKQCFPQQWCKETIAIASKDLCAT